MQHPSFSSWAGQAIWRGLFLLAMAGSVGRAADNSAKVEEGFVPLFDGQTLRGWTRVNVPPETFQATNGVIFCTGAPIGELRTTRMYQNFVLELEWRHLRAKGNAGVFVWADALTARGQPFIRGIEVQVLDGMEGDWYTSDGDIFPIHGARMRPENGRGGDRAFPTEKRMKASPEWNHYRIECRDGAIALSVNGKVVTRGTECSPRKGYICLESEGSPVEFRNLRIRELPATTALSPEHIAATEEGFLPLYSGLDLRNWNLAAGQEGAWKVQDWVLDVSPFTGDGEAPLESVDVFGDVELIFDWRWSGKEQRGRIEESVLFRMGGRGNAEWRRLGDEIRNAERAVGEWNRARWKVRGNSLEVDVNGRAVGGTLEFAAAVPRGRLQLFRSRAPLQLANLFVRRLD